MNGKYAVVSIWMPVLLMFAGGLGFACQEEPSSGDECTTSAQCDASESTSGHICSDGACVACTEDEQCVEDPSYGESIICRDGRCAPACPPTENGCACGPNGECAEGLACDAEAICRPVCEGDDCASPVNCSEDAENSILLECAAQTRYCLELRGTAICGDCLDGFVEDGGECREAVTCADLDCDGQLRDCTEAAGNADAMCLDCTTGHLDVDGMCYPMTCDWGVPGSIAYRCQSEKRLCADSGEFARCGDCVVRYLENDGMCRSIQTCTDIGCGTLKRECVPATLWEDAYCGDCMGGYRDEWGDCVPLAGAVCSGGGSTDISSICTTLSRDCVTPPCSTPPCDPAYCGGCTWEMGCDEEPTRPALTCSVELPSTGQCEPFIPCSAFGGCAPFNRNCNDDPTAHCTTCLFTPDIHTDVDYIEDMVTGNCRPAVTCASVSCSAGTQCQPHTETSDAFCRPGCPDGQIWSESGCLHCPPCQGAGEDGIWPFPTKDGRCICRTQAGYFYNLAGDISAYPCDEDGDGWVRESARSAINSDDPVISRNARCQVRTVTRFVLENRVVNWFNPTVDCVGEETCAGYTVIELDAPLELYETDRNDDQYLLELFYAKAPYYGDRQPEARELNRLTKFCVNGADYNDNLVNDMDEWDYRPLPPGFPISLEPFNWFSYFAELHRGWYEPPVGNERHGSYYIREKSRRQSAPPGDRVPIRTGASTPEAEFFYETCPLWRDPAFNASNPTVGRDFARWSPTPNTIGFAMIWDPGMTRLQVPAGGGNWVSVAYGWEGMGLHSQYKCVQIVENGNPDYEPSVRPQLMTLSDVTSAHMVANTCGIDGAEDTIPPPDEADETNPTDPVVTCSVRDAQVGFVGWVSRGYGSYTGIGNDRYPGGCVNQIVATRGRCGTCGLGRWVTDTGMPLGGPDGSLAYGDFDIPAGCDDVDLTPMESSSFDLTELDCDDESSNSSFLFVDAATGDDYSHHGSRRYPFATISAALDRADYLNGLTFSGRRVIGVVVTAGEYTENVVVRDGVSILGGYTVESRQGELFWIRTDGPSDTPQQGNHPGLTRIAAVTVMSGPDRLVGMEARTIETPTLLDRLFVDTRAGEHRGVSLIGIAAMDSPGLHLRDCRVHIGDAPDGISAPDTPNTPQNGGAGFRSGAPRYNACPSSPEYATGQRGGGTVNCASYPTWSGCDRLWGQNHPAGAAGGTNTCAADPECASCATSTNGVDGINGQAGANATPMVSALGNSGFWTGGEQQDGERGGTGRGGAGGPGFWTADGSCTTWVRGGGGGAGGCGGLPGAGGGHGGSAIALLAVGSTDLRIEGCTFVTGDAGDGGGAAPGGRGGAGGAGAAPTGHDVAHRGGTGGRGGDGGHGVGGNGGVSCALLIHEDSVVDRVDAIWTRGTHGDGGHGASSAENPENPSSAPGIDGAASLAALSNSHLVCE